VDLPVADQTTHISQRAEQKPDQHTTCKSGKLENIQPIVVSLSNLFGGTMPELWRICLICR
jgi:hypothetical protein